MALQKLKKGFFSGTSKIFDGTLENLINSIIDAVNAGGGGAAYTDADAVNAVKTKQQIASLAEVSVADATTAEEAVAVANANKAAINAVIAALKA